MNKASEGFVYTEELSEENEGSKRTLASYWKSMETEGKDCEKVSVVISLHYGIFDRL